MNDIQSYIIDNSPMEFIVAAASEGGRRVWIRSNGASLDLIGSEALETGQHELSPTYSVFNRFIELLVPTIQIHKVETQIYEPWDFKESNINFPPSEVGSFDDRLTKYSFVWKGVARNSFKRRLQHEFERRSLDIAGAILRDRESDIEWHVSPMVALCMREQLLVSKAKRTLAMLTIVYAGITAAVTMWTFYW